MENIDINIIEYYCEKIKKKCKSMIKKNKVKFIFKLNIFTINTNELIIALKKHDFYIKNLYMNPIELESCCCGIIYPAIEISFFNEKILNEYL